MKQTLTFTNDAERFAWIKKHLYVPAVCDVPDSLDIDPRGWLATAMLHDHEDNLFLNQ